MYLPWLLGGAKHVKGIFKNDPLLLRIPRRSKGPSKGKPQHQTPGYGQSCCLLPVNHYYYRGDTGSFDSPGDQSTGLMAEGSGGANDYSIDILIS